MKNIIFDLGSVILKGKGSDFLKEMNIDEDTYNELKYDLDKISSL